MSSQNPIKISDNDSNNSNDDIDKRTIIFCITDLFDSIANYLPFGLSSDFGSLGDSGRFEYLLSEKISHNLKYHYYDDFKMVSFFCQLLKPF